MENRFRSRGPGRSFLDDIWQICKPPIIESDSSGIFKLDPTGHLGVKTVTEAFLDIIINPTHSIQYLYVDIPY
jgi:hypothetical protein